MHIDEKRASAIIAIAAIAAVGPYMAAVRDAVTHPPRAILAAIDRAPTPAARRLEWEGYLLAVELPTPLTPIISLVRGVRAVRRAL